MNKNYYVNNCNDCIKNNLDNVIINSNRNDKSCLCEPGPQGIQGEPDPAGGLSDYADFFALMPPDNSATVAPGANVEFPQEGVTNSTIIARTGSDTFTLSEVGSYLVIFQVGVTVVG